MPQTKDSIWTLCDKQKLIWCYVRGRDVPFIAHCVLRKDVADVEDMLERILSGETRFRSYWGHCSEKFKWTERQDHVLRECREYGLKLKTVSHILARSPVKIKRRWREIKDE